MQNSILAYLSHFKRFYAQAFAPLAKKYELSQLEIDILLFLHNNPQYNTARDIVEIRGFQKSNVSTAVESLRKKGYLSSICDPENRKVHRLLLTPALRERFCELSRGQQEAFSRLLQGCSPQERALFHSFLSRIDKNVTGM